MCAGLLCHPTEKVKSTPPSTENVGRAKKKTKKILEKNSLETASSLRPTSLFELGLARVGDGEVIGVPAAHRTKMKEKGGGRVRG